MKKEHKKGEAYCEDGYVHGKVDMERGNISKAFGDMIDNAKPDSNKGDLVLEEQVKRQTDNILELLQYVDENYHDVIQKSIKVIIGQAYLDGFNEGIK